jgi:hypothetical protein
MLIGRDPTLALPKMGKKNVDEFTDEEIACRRDAVIKHMLNTPPKPHSAMKIGKRKAKRAKSPAPKSKSMKSAS